MGVLQSKHLNQQHKAIGEEEIPEWTVVSWQLCANEAWQPCAETPAVASGFLGEGGATDLHIINMSPLCFAERPFTHCCHFMQFIYQSPKSAAILLTEN